MQENTFTLLLLAGHRAGDTDADRVHDALEARHDVTTAPTITSAVESLRTAQPDVIVVDLTRPLEAGVEVVSRLHEEAPAVPVVVLTGDDEEGYEALRRGGVDHLSKARADDDLLDRVVRYAVERARLRQMLREERVRAATVRETRRALLRVVGRDVRAPMNNVVGYTDVLADSTLDEEQRACVDAIVESSDRMLLVLDELIEFARIESGDLRLQAQPFDLRQVVEVVEGLFAKRAARRGLTLSSHVDEDLPTTVVGDPARVREILVRIGENAVAFTGAGRITITAEPEHASGRFEAVHLAVRDTGPGVPVEIRDDVFEPFVQATVSVDGGRDGTGLGLAICRGLVEAMGGTIAVDSGDDGSTFHVTLPLSEAPATGGAAAGGGRATVASHVDDVDAQRNGSQGPPPTLRVLVAEDEAVTAQLMVRLLEKHDYHVHHVVNGAEAVEAALEGDYDLILMDVTMPHMDGVSAMQTIKTRLSGDRCPIIVAVTAHAMKGDRERFLAAGMDGYVSKPVRAAALLAAVREAAASIERR